MAIYTLKEWKQRRSRKLSNTTIDIKKHILVVTPNGPSVFVSKFLEEQIEQINNKWERITIRAFESEGTISIPKFS